MLVKYSTYKQSSSSQEGSLSSTSDMKLVKPTLLVDPSNHSAHPLHPQYAVGPSLYSAYHWCNFLTHYSELIVSIRITEYTWCTTVRWSPNNALKARQSYFLGMISPKAARVKCLSVNYEKCDFKRYLTTSNSSQATMFPLTANALCSLSRSRSYFRLPLQCGPDI